MELLSTGIFRTIVKKVSPVIPQIEKPKKKVTLKNKLIWTGRTKSLNIDDISKTTDEIIEEVIRQMKKDGFMEK